MKKLFYIFLFLPVLSILSCSSDDKDKREFGDFKIEIINNKISSPAWLKKVISEQMVSGEQKDFFPGIVYGITIENQDYILVSNQLSSSSCIALQIYTLKGESISCDSELHRTLFAVRVEEYNARKLWSGFDSDL